MTASRLSHEVKNQGSCGPPSDPDSLAYGEPARVRAVAEAVAVVASGSTENRHRWIQSLQKRFTVCEVAERRALERIMVSLRPKVLIVDLDLPGLRRVRGLPFVQTL